MVYEETWVFSAALVVRGLLYQNPVPPPIRCQGHGQLRHLEN